MTSPGIVSRPEAVTAEWLTAALAASGHLDRGEVESFTAERVGTGLVGLNVRFSLRYRGDPGGGPAAVVAKFPSPDDVSRATGIAMRNYEREVRFYREIAGTVGIRMPICYFAGIDMESGDFVLLLEDLAPANPGNQITGCTVAEAELALTELARLHGPRWDDASLDQIDWLSRHTDEGAEQLQALYQALWPMFIAKYGPSLSPAAIDLTERLGASLAAWLDAREAPFTVTHGDYRLDNMLFGTAAGGYPLAVVDWQTPGHGPGISDAAYFLGAGLLVDTRREYEEALVRGYHRSLLEQGVTGYPWSRCWDEYRRFAFSGVIMTVVASMVVAADDRGVAMFTAMGQRHTAAALDLHAEAFLTG
ncbi:MAG: hypothetical protein QOG64_1560 [Acidimicrobiaceae bacterium]|jgi:hypothetical protein|nr:hypothetical protein [Acidimicrobiaceae bacterium]